MRIPQERIRKPTWSQIKKEAQRIPLAVGAKKAPHGFAEKAKSWALDALAAVPAAAVSAPPLGGVCEDSPAPVFPDVSK